jgi:hypothetical protein
VNFDTLGISAKPMGMEFMRKIVEKLLSGLKVIPGLLLLR